MCVEREGLSELVFEGLPEQTAVRLSSAILGHRVVAPTLADGVCEHEVARLVIGSSVELRGAHLRILRYEVEVFDVEINFVPAEALKSSSESVIEALHDFAIRLGKAHGVRTYYAGLERASDEDTRYFTGEARGPYM